MPLDQVERQLVADFRANPKLVVNIRADRKAAYEYFMNAVERCRKNGITTFSFRTEAGATP